MNTFLAEPLPNLTRMWASNLEYSKIELVVQLWTLWCGCLEWLNLEREIYSNYFCWISNNTILLIFSMSWSLFLLALFFCLLENILQVQYQYFFCHFLILLLWYIDQYKGMKGDMIQYRCNNNNFKSFIDASNQEVLALLKTWTHTYLTPVRVFECSSIAPTISSN